MIRPRMSLFAVLLLGVVTTGVGVARADVSRHEPMMTIPYGFGPNEVDTTLCEYGLHWKNLIASYRVVDDGALWLMTAGSRPSVRRFESVDGRGVETRRIDLPNLPGRYDDFLIDGDEVILSQSLSAMADQATFYRVAGDSILQRIVLARKVGYNRLRGWGVANLGRLRYTGGEIYNAFVRNSSCIRIGAKGRLSPRLEPADIVPGIPVLAGEPIWAGRSIVFRGIAPVLDLGTDPPGQLEEVFDDGGFVIQRAVADSAARAAEEDFEIYDASGVRKRDVRLHLPDPSFFTVTDGEVDYFTERAIYQLEFDRKEITLVRY